MHLMKRLVPAMICAVSSVAAFGQDKLAADPEAKKTFETVCTRCHELSLITERRALHDVWAKAVRRMVAEGAGATDAQYLSIRLPHEELRAGAA
jgi:cytochrome c5